MNAKKNNEKSEYVTRKDLEEQTQIILEAMDVRLEKMEAGLGKKTDNVRDELYIVRNELKGDINRVENKLEEVKQDLRIDMNNVQTLIDGYVKAQEDFKQEFVIMKREMDEIKKIIREKLGMEVKLA